MRRPRRSRNRPNATVAATVSARSLQPTRRASRQRPGPARGPAHRPSERGLFHGRRLFGRSRLVALCWLVVVGLLSWCPMTLAQGLSDRPGGAPGVPASMLVPRTSPASRDSIEGPPRGIIVKYRSRGANALTECAEMITSRGESFQAHTADRADSLDRLRERLALGRHRALFRKADGSGLAMERRRLNLRLARARAARSRPSTAIRLETLPELSHIYQVSPRGWPGSRARGGRSASGCPRRVCPPGLRTVPRSGGWLR